MLHTKACPRCTGDLTLVRDVGDTYLSRVQCVYLSYQLNEARQQRDSDPAPAPSR
jgi:hypothetical protein